MIGMRGDIRERARQLSERRMIERWQRDIEKEQNRKAWEAKKQMIGSLAEKAQTALGFKKRAQPQVTSSTRNQKSTEQLAAERAAAEREAAERAAAEEEAARQREYDRMGGSRRRRRKHKKSHKKSYKKKKSLKKRRSSRRHRSRRR